MPRPVPGTMPPAPGGAAPPWPVSAAIVLHVGDHTITRLATITDPALPGLPGGSPIRRSLVADNALWTLSEAGLKASDLTTLTPLGWIPFE